MNEHRLTLQTSKERLLRDIARLKETAKAADQGLWWRSHNAIVSGSSTTGTLVALAETYELKKGHGGWPTDPKLDAPNTRHIVATQPKKLIELLERIEKELQS